MAKKTKKEKIIADYRRKIKLLYQINIEKDNPNDNKKKSLLRKKIDNEKINSTPKKGKQEYDNKFLDYNLYECFKSDLKKSIIISFFIFTLEFIIYFAMLKIKLY